MKATPRLSPRQAWALLGAWLVGSGALLAWQALRVPPSWWCGPLP